MYRQGDVLIIPAKIPSDLKKIELADGQAILAYGEATGHAHAIRDRRISLFRDEKLALLFMHVAGDDCVALEHEEHGAILIPPGDYQVIRQREYSPAEIRNVAD